VAQFTPGTVIVIMIATVTQSPTSSNNFLRSRLMNLFFSGIVESCAVVNDVAVQANNSPVVRKRDGTVIKDGSSGSSAVWPRRDARDARTANGNVAFANTTVVGNRVSADGQVDPRVDGVRVAGVAPAAVWNGVERRITSNSAYLTTLKTDRRIAAGNVVVASTVTGNVVASTVKPVVLSTPAVVVEPTMHANGTVTPAPTTNLHWFNSEAQAVPNTDVVIDPNTGYVLHDPANRRSVTMTVVVHDQKDAQHYHGSITFTCEVPPGAGVPKEGDLVTVEVKG
jgi:hypothetical protein